MEKMVHPPIDLIDTLGDKILIRQFAWSFLETWRLGMVDSYLEARHLWARKFQIFSLFEGRLAFGRVP